MAVSFMIKLICSNHGAMDYGDLVDIGSGLLDVKGVIDTVMGNDQFFVVTLNGNKRVVTNTKVRLCKTRECTDCCNLHLCKFYLYGDCRNSLGRRGCRFCHDMDSEHNARVLRDNDLQDLDRTELCTLLLQNDSTLVPPVCFSYNKGDGEYGNCPDQESCRRLHICDRYLRGTCRAGGECSRSHDFFEPHPLKTLQERGVPSELIGSMLFVYQNIQAMNNRDNSNSNKQQTHGGNANNSRTGREKTEICLYFVKGSCNQGDRCWREHSSLPYKWEVRNGNSWSALPDNEKIEKDFCIPANVYSQGAPPVYFDAMTCGSAQVRRLSTVSSVLQPTFVLTTEWAWYWQDEYDNWIQYSSLEGQHRLSSITSEDLERKYQEDSSAVLEFTAGSQAYKLFFQDMLQTNEQYGTVRLVRRRPVFVSTAGAQKARTSKSRPSHNFKAVPAYWDKSMLPDTGYKKITLQDSSDEYQKILSLFHQTMRGYRLASVERVQNRALWEVFQWQKDLMRKNNAGRNVNERLLFHGTDSTHVDAICMQNFDWRLCGTHGTAYGKGSYFARDAKYSHSYTGSSGMRTMFVCQVLVGGYTKGDSSYLRPPSKDGGDSVFYDSCVDNVRDPSIFVVFEKHQVYPEYIIMYDEDMRFPSAFGTVTVSSIPAPSMHRASSLTTMISNPAQALPPISASSVFSRPAQAAPPVSASSVISNPAQAPPPISASSVFSRPAQAPPPISASSVFSKPAQAPPPISASSVFSRPAQAPPPISASSVFSRPGQAPPPVSASSVISNPAQAPPPVSASSVFSRPAQAPPPISASSVFSRPAQAPPPISASSVFSRPGQAPPPVSASSVFSRPAQAPPPVSASSVISHPAQAPPPLSAHSVISKQAQAPPPISASSVFSNPAQAAPPVSASSVISKPAQAPPPVSASSVFSRPAQVPPPLSAHSVISKPAQAPPPVSASSVFSRPAQAPPPVNASTVISNPAQAPPPISASSVFSRPAQAPRPVNASFVISNPAQVPPPVSTRSGISNPAQAPPPVNARSVISKPAQAPPPVSARSVISNPAQAPPPISASSVFSRPAQAAPPVSASSVISNPAQAPPPISASSVFSRPAQAPLPVNARSVISKPAQAPPPGRQEGDVAVPGFHHTLAAWKEREQKQ